MKDVVITISKETSMVYLSKSVIGNDGENLQGNIVFKFDDEFVNGVARLETIISGNKQYLLLNKNDEEYYAPIKSVLTKKGEISLQLVITEEESEAGIPIFKSNIFKLYCNASINAEIEMPEEYPQWIEYANQKLVEIEKGIEEVKRFELEVGTLENDVKELNDKVDELDEDVKQVVIDTANVEVEVENLTNNVNRIASDVNTNTDNINVLERNYTNLHNELLEQEESINHLEDTKADKTEIPDVSNKQDKLTAGENITIVNNVISAKGGDVPDLNEYVKKSYLENINNQYVKDGLVNNNIHLTDEEQIKIEDWLGLAHNYLTYYNEIPYQVTGDYVPAHKKYVDSKLGPDLTNYLDKTNTGTNILKGKIQIGDKDANITNAILHIRNVGSSSITGKSVNGACYSVNGDGTASLQHKTYNDDGTGAKNDAVLRMSNKGVQFAINSGSGASPSESDYKELATQEYVDEHSSGGTKNILTPDETTQSNPIDFDTLPIGHYELSTTNSTIYFKNKMTEKSTTGYSLDSYTRKIELVYLKKFEEASENEIIGWFLNIDVNDASNSMSYKLSRQPLRKLKSGNEYYIGISSSSYWQIEAVNRNGTQVIGGKKTFTTLPESSVVPTTDNQLVNKKYVDDQITARITSALEADY